ncbi:MAG: hypothetical protein LBE01_03075 [Deltaproteobacteria bacterium]|jgi:hypothetical protein|nr:hypothetical protein [Deltaproteobacteria bacterium]
MTAKAGDSAKIFRAAALLAFLPLFLGACGVKTHPYPEAAVLPGPVRELTQSQGPDGQLWLTWLSPLENMVNRPLRTLDHFEVWGADYERKGFCDGCPVTYRKLAEVYLLSPPPGALVAEGPYRWETTVKPDRAYRFRVAGFSGRGSVNPQSWREVTVFGQANPGALAHFSAKADDLSVRLSWAKPKAGQRVEVQRLTPEREWVALAGLDEAKGSYEDLDVAYGRVYVYRARLLAEDGQSLAPGPFSPEIRASVEDLLPPRPIGFLDAAMAQGGVRLRWENLAQEDRLAGYRLYRRLAGESSFRPVGGLIQGNSYLDGGVGPGETAYYQVTAVDASPAANESRPSPVASVMAAPEEEELRRPDLADPGL